MYSLIPRLHWAKYRFLRPLYCRQTSAYHATRTPSFASPYPTPTTINFRIPSMCNYKPAICMKCSQRFDLQVSCCINYSPRSKTDRRCEEMTIISSIEAESTGVYITHTWGLYTDFVGVCDLCKAVMEMRRLAVVSDD
jgi:hypothetical protein